jgi:hypothetical protein
MERYAEAWEFSEYRRRRLLWERAALGAAATLGNRLDEYPAPRFHGDRDRPQPIDIPPPLRTIPEWATSNWRQIVDELLDYYGGYYNLIDVRARNRNDRVLVMLRQELAYRLLTFGRRFGRPMGAVDVGEIVNRDRATVLYSRRVHYLRMLRSKPGYYSERPA